MKTIQYNPNGNSLPNVIQYGTDGFGHQLEGMIGVVAMHICKKVNYLFNHNREYHFEHNNADQKCADYMSFALSSLSKIFPQTNLNLKEIIHSHEVWKIPKDFRRDVIYSLDNAFYEPIEQLNKSLEILQKVFCLENPYLPKPAISDANYIAIHVRLGDAKDRQSELNLLFDIIDYCIKKSSNKIIIHTNGEIPFSESDKVKIFDKQIHVLQVLSDLIYANSLVLSNSSLSIASSWFNTKSKQIIAPSCYQSSSRLQKTISYSNFLDVAKFINSL